MLKVAPCTVLRSYNQIFSGWWVTTILYNYGATICELRYKAIWCVSIWLVCNQFHGQPISKWHGVPRFSQWEYEEKKLKKSRRRHEWFLEFWRILDKVYFIKITRLITNFVQRKSNIIKIKARGLPLVKKSDTLKIFSTEPVFSV